MKQREKLEYGETIMFYNAKEKKLNLYNTQIDTISFGSGKKKLIMIQGLNTRGIKGASVSLAYMYRLFWVDF